MLFASGVWIMVVAERPGDNTGRVADFLTCRIGLGSDFRSRAKPGRDGRGCGPDADLFGGGELAMFGISVKWWLE